MRSRPAREAKNGWPMDSSASRSSGSARNTSSGTGLPVGSSRATSKQNDLRRMSNECAVDLALVSEPSTRTVTSGSARHSVRTRSKMSSGTSTGALTREPPNEPAGRSNALTLSTSPKSMRLGGGPTWGASPPAHDAGSPPHPSGSNDHTKTAFASETSGAPLTNHRRSLAAPTTYRRNAARVAAAVELKYSGGSMKPHSWNVRPLVRARR